MHFAIVKREADDYPPCNEGSNADHNCEAITNVACTVIEAEFHVGCLSAYGAVFIHLHHSFQPVGIFLFEEFSSPASWALIAQYAENKTGFCGYVFVVV